MSRTLLVVCSHFETAERADDSAEYTRRVMHSSLDIDPNSRTVLSAQPEVKRLRIAASLRIEQTLSCVYIFGKYVGE